MKTYTGIGSRSTPPEVCAGMTQIAQQLSKLGWVLRSGYASGADQAFGRGARFREIFLPWPHFNGAMDGQYGHSVLEPTKLIEQIAREHHPNWPACSSAARLLHMRNVLQVLGPDCRTPTDMVICWTPKGSGSGGTGQAIRIARAHNIPVFDLALTSAQDQLCDFLKEREAA